MASTRVTGSSAVNSCSEPTQNPVRLRLERERYGAWGYDGRQGSPQLSEQGREADLWVQMLIGDELFWQSLLGGEGGELGG